LSTLPETKVTTLPNGLRIATETIPFAQTATVGLWINNGSRFENDDTHGSASFLESLLFRGTKKRSEKDLALEVESIGGHLTAATGREMSSYCMKVLGKDVRKAMDILSDCIVNPALDELAIEAEKQAIFDEIEALNKSHSEILFDHLHATAFQWSPLGRTVRGTIESIGGLNRQSLTEYMNTNFRAGRMVLSAAGNVNHDELVKMATDMLGGIKAEEPGATIKDIIANEPSFWTGSDVRDRRPDVHELCLVAAFKGAAWTDPDAVPLMVMQTMLGAWDKTCTVGQHVSSPLSQAWACGGFGDAVMGFNTNYLDTGLFGIYGLTDNHRAADAAWSVMNEMVRMCYEVSDNEVVRARNTLKAKIANSMDSTHSVAESIGRDMLVYGRRLSKAELFARIDAVDASVVRTVADRFFYDQDVAVSAVGDVQQLADYNSFRRRTFWLRY
jgi:processing peptidase subunit beta